MAADPSNAKTVAIESKPWTRGPAATLAGENAIVRDLEKLGDAVNGHASMIDSNTQEIRKLQNTPPGAGGGSETAGSLQTLNICVNSVAMTIDLYGNPPVPV